MWREEAVELVEDDEAFEAAGAGEAADPGEDLFEDHAEDEGALFVVEVGDADHGGGRAAVDGAHPRVDVEARAATPREEAWRGEQRVEVGGELFARAEAEEVVDGERADVIERRLEEVGEERFERVTPLRRLSGVPRAGTEVFARCVGDAETKRCAPEEMSTLVQKRGHAAAEHVGPVAGDRGSGGPLEGISSIVREDHGRVCGGRGDGCAMHHPHATGAGDPARRPRGVPHRLLPGPRLGPASRRREPPSGHEPWRATAVE